ncbi:MAG: hypothetical protein GY758_28080 [Fuerstiella sp.]|jgi:hypothetical protein|nr:hypothetical protein [Fuerstiella sp.]MCP4504915.1 hypothetical protein [Fuerstiella sp.]MDG2129403.1 hypothetical protein [Fuerstiella sp.]
MIPAWLLTVLHYLSLTSAAAILLLLIWQPIKRFSCRTKTASAVPSDQPSVRTDDEATSDNPYTPPNPREEK